MFQEFSKIIVLCIIILNIIFASAVLIVFWHTSSEPGILVGAWFAFTTGELWALATLKKDQRRLEENKEENLE